MIRKTAIGTSFQELIDNLEHIEIDQLHSDIPANVRAELSRVKKNLSLILAFLGNYAHLDSASEPELRDAINTLRSECMSLNLRLTRLLVLHFFRINALSESQYPILAVDQYQRIGRAICQMCQMAAPQLAAQLSSSF